MSCSRPELDLKGQGEPSDSQAPFEGAARAACRGPNAQSGVNHQAPIALGDSTVEWNSLAHSRSLHGCLVGATPKGAAARRREGKIEDVALCDPARILVSADTRRSASSDHLDG